MRSAEEQDVVLVLVGHGAPATDTPRELVTRLKQLEGMRRARKLPPDDEEMALDKRVREWPRTAETDPYREALESLARALRAGIAPPIARVVVAYNELCAPSLEHAVRELAASGVRRIVIVPSMFTRGGVHSEVEIPETIEALEAELPELVITYAWPFREADIAALMLGTATPLVRPTLS